jgi:uncharacterized membrane protein
MNNKGFLFKFSLIILLIILSLNFANAAIIRGNVYDKSLNKVNDVIVIINSNPIQRYVVKDGTYFFELPPGRYTLNARTFTNDTFILGTDVDLIITKEGTFIYDLVLNEISKEELEQELPEPYEEDIIIIEKENKNYLNLIAIIIGIIIILLIIIFGFFYLNKKINIKKKESTQENIIKTDGLNFELITDNTIYKIDNDINETKDNEEILKDDYLNQVFNLIKKEKRITQKDIRKNFDLSEAKISLIISELEDKKLIKKIKKGRGNIIIINE